MDGNQPSIPHMKAMDVPFHLPYGMLISIHRLHSDRPKCRGGLVDPGTPRRKAEIRCFVPGLNYIYLLEKLKFFVSLGSPGSPLSNEIW